MKAVEENRIGLATSRDGLSDCIAQIFEDPALHKSLGENAAQWAVAYDWHTKFEKHMGLLG